MKCILLHCTWGGTEGCYTDRRVVRFSALTAASPYGVFLVVRE
uniref:Uncharacterized protein n=1 Tax=Anguilla anguilla TaxID=7936 RepID=A0A0E9PJZ5_ANGAN